ncbi:VF530 family protein [Shewanella subflava]|uniref:VF530 family protein n=1 Tax=Shewanella subflava TaxID=2986476 RepID=A0ABT3IDP9_9GAMM|nr:VF530 family protein [Shewanella subflava]MCW3174186.1 VF530 family protein [Shewanella subflava]
MTQQNNPLHGIKLETIMTYLVDKYGWEELALRINIRCFKENPSIKSSLTFLRKTQWARDKVEYLYLKSNKLPLPIRADRNEPAKKPIKKPSTVIKKPSQSATKASIDTNSSSSNSTINAQIWGKS